MNHWVYWDPECMKEAPVLIWMNLWVKAYGTASGCCSPLFSLILDQAPGPHPKFLKQHSSFFFSFLPSNSSRPKAGYVSHLLGYQQSRLEWIGKWKDRMEVQTECPEFLQKHSYNITSLNLLISQNEPLTPHSLSLKLDIFYLLKHYCTTIISQNTCQLLLFLLL